MNNFRLPTFQQRVAVIGRTGSGKTRFGTWLLSQAPFDKQPYIIVDYKGDDLIGTSDRIIEIGLKDKLPTVPGLFVIRPMPHQEDEMEEWLWKVWAHEQTGLYFDEAYNVPKKAAFNAILTQGRSKRLPCICLSQRPSWLSRFVFSEADFFAVFQLNDREDQKRVQQFIPRDKADITVRLDSYHSYWYDVGRDALFIMRPVPDDETIVSLIETKLAPRRKFF